MNCFQSQHYEALVFIGLDDYWAEGLVDNRIIVLDWVYYITALGQGLRCGVLEASFIWS